MLRHSFFSPVKLSHDAAALYKLACSNESSLKMDATACIPILADYFDIDKKQFAQHKFLARQILKHVIFIMSKTAKTDPELAFIYHLEKLIDKPSSWEAHALSQKSDGALVLHYPDLNYEQRKTILKVLNQEYKDVGVLHEDMYPNKASEGGPSILLAKKAFFKRVLPTMAAIYRLSHSSGRNTFLRK